jgi:hypothetical protein
VYSSYSFTGKNGVRADGWQNGKSMQTVSGTISYMQTESRGIESAFVVGVMSQVPHIYRII